MRPIPPRASPASTGHFLCRVGGLQRRASATGKRWCRARSRCTAHSEVLRCRTGDRGRCAEWRVSDNPAALLQHLGLPARRALGQEGDQPGQHPLLAYRTAQGASLSSPGARAVRDRPVLACGWELHEFAALIIRIFPSRRESPRFMTTQALRHGARGGGRSSRVLT